MYPPRTILHPTDYSDCARHAFDLAVRIARLHGAGLIVLHVVDSLGPEGISFGEAASQLQPHGHRRQLLDELHRVVAPPGADIHLKHVLAEGEPAAAIVETARKEHCDLIVMGTHGRGALSRFLTGSVTHRVTSNAPCPVLTVRNGVPA